MSLTLTPADVEAVATKFLEILAGRGLFTPRPAPVLDRAEAMKLVKKKSDSALDRWVAQWAPSARCGHGRFNRERLERGMLKEAKR